MSNTADNVAAATKDNVAAAGDKVGDAAVAANQQAESLLKQGIDLASSTLSYAQAQVSHLTGVAQQKGAEASSQARSAADDAAGQAQGITNAAAQEGEKGSAQAEQTLGDLVHQTRGFVANVLDSANEYVKPAHGGQTTTGSGGIVEQARVVAGNAVETISHIARGESDDANKLANDAAQKANDLVNQAAGTVKDYTK